MALRTRARLLGCLEEGSIVTGKARALRGKLHALDKIPENRPPISFAAFSGGPVTDEEFLSERGVKIEDESSRVLQALVKPANDFSSAHSNSVPSEADVELVLPKLQALHAALVGPSAQSAHPFQRAQAWAHLIAASAKVVHQNGLPVAGDTVTFVADVLLEGSRNEDPKASLEDNASFDSFPSWGSPSPRIDAASGLIFLIALQRPPAPEVIEAVLRLSRDPVAAVRFQIVSELWRMHESIPEIMWDAIEERTAHEKSQGVLSGLVAGAISRLAGAYPDRAVCLLTSVLERPSRGSRETGLRESILQIVTMLYLYRDHATSGSLIRSIVSNTTANAADASLLPVWVREALAYGGDKAADAAVRRRGIRMALDLVVEAKRGLQSISPNSSPAAEDASGEAPEHPGAKLVAILDSIASQVYFGSGAYGAGQSADAATRSHRLPSNAERFYKEAESLLDELTLVPIPTVTHHLVETLEAYIPVDPESVFSKIAAAVRSAANEGYRDDSLAADLIVRIVERYLADYRGVFRDNDDCRRSLIELLDSFAGWPSARRLTYRLEDIFR